MSTIDEAAREASENYAAELKGLRTDPIIGSKIDYECGFLAGVEYARKNPSAEVTGLIEALAAYKAKVEK